MTRRCPCSAPIGPANKSGLCRPCGLAKRNADPEFQARRAEASRAASAKRTPESRSRASKAASVKRLANPEYRAWLTEHLRSIAPLAHAPELKASRAKKLSVAVSDYRLPWCPRELRPLYRQLTRSKGLTPAEAREIVETEMRRPVAAPPPLTFEERLAKVASGEARIVEAQHFPYRPANDDFTLAGGSALA